MRYFFMIIIFGSIIYSSFGNTDSLNVSDTVNPDKIKMILGQVKFGDGVKDLSEKKIEAALALTAELTGKYELIPNRVRDSLAVILKSKSIESSVSNIALEAGAERIVFLTINRLKNMLRIELVSFVPEDKGRLLSGVGYGLIHYRYEKDEQALYDPTLLEALQRAFAVSEGDSMMFASLEGAVQVFPAKTIVIGGLVFQDNAEQPPWELFSKKDVISYYIAETIYEKARLSKTFVVWDMDSRDSIYALANLYLVDNYHPATTQELECLIRLDVDCFITGTFARTENGAGIEIYLCNIVKNQLEFIKSVAGSITQDKVETLRAKVKELTAKLLDINLTESKKTGIKN